MDLIYHRDCDHGGPDFLTRHGAGPGDADPMKVPYYLVLVGGPDRIPFSIQCDLQLAHAVGRLGFERACDFAQYAEQVAHVHEDEKGRRKALLYGPCHDRMTSDTVNKLLAPLDKALNRRHPVSDIQYALPEAFTAAKFRRMLHQAPPKLLFTASHGVCFKSAYENRALQGAPFRGILSLEWRWLLQRLARCSDNVTLIHDCCHALRFNRQAVAKTKAVKKLWGEGVQAFLEQLKTRQPQIFQACPPRAGAPVFIAATGFQQPAYEIMDGMLGPVGALTRKLTDALCM